VLYSSASSEQVGILEGVYVSVCWGGHVTVYGALVVRTLCHVMVSTLSGVSVKILRCTLDRVLGDIPCRVLRGTLVRLLRGVYVRVLRGLPVQEYNAKCFWSPMQSCQTLRLMTPVCLSNSKCFQAPVGLSKVIANPRQAVSGVSKTTCRYEGVFKMLWYLTSMIVT
jgi:hypothetical protein